MAETNLSTINKSKRPSTEPALRQTTVTSCAEFNPISIPTNYQPQIPIQILRLPDVMKRVGLCRASIYQHIADGSFPKQISLGARAVGWLEHEIDAWLMARIQARGKEAKLLTSP